MYRVLSDEAEEFHGYHCFGRSLVTPGQCSSAGPPLVPPLHRQLATEAHKTSSPWTAARGLDDTTVLPTVLGTAGAPA
jgi:hypothetical protein